MESGRLELEETWTEPHRIIHEVLQVLSIKAQEKGLTLHFSAQDPIPRQIKTDPGRLRQILFNLLGNAIKFTDRGSVTVTCRLMNTLPEPRLRIDIADTGIGIPQDKIEWVFEPFAQADATASRRFGGTGLGLSISRKFAQALGGEITVISRLAKGSTFSVTLKTGDLQGVPFLQPEEVAAATEGFESKEIRRWRFPRSRVLIVDDGAENRELLRLVLEDAGLTADEAENGQAGVEKATSGLYDVILMDVYMPVLDGFAAARKLRQQGVKTSIIALTANAMKGFEEECLAAGYSGYFSKPIDLDRFMEMMAELLGAKPVEKESEAAAESPAQPAQAEGQPVMSRLGSNPKFRKVILQFTEKLKRELARAQTAWEREDLKELALIAHWLKGAAGTVGFDPFTEPAAKLEHLAKTDQREQAGEMLRHVKRLSEAIVPPTSAFDRKAA